MLEESVWEVPPAWYAKFRGRYPKAGRGFPVSYNPQTPSEILSDDRILGASSKMTGRGYTVLRQPRLETEAMTMVEGEGMGELVQIKSGEGQSLTLKNKLLVDPLQQVIMNLLLLGGSLYIVFSTPYIGIRVAGTVVAMGSGLNLISLFKDVSSEPTTAYTQVRPSYEV